MLNIRSGLLGVTLASVLSLTSAYAADISYGGLKDPCCGPLWSGPYFGVHGGYASSSVDVRDISGLGNTFSNNGSGAFGGGTWGWNWQSGHLVWGAEFDLGVMDVSHTAIDPAIHTTTAHLGTGVYGDITARVGYAFGGTLLYTKGGFAYFNGDGTVKGAGDATFKTQSFTGWTLGGGVEYKVTPNWSVKAEYLHLDVGDQSVRSVTSGARWDNSVTIDTVKIGVNYEILDTPKPLK